MAAKTVYLMVERKVHSLAEHWGSLMAGLRVGSSGNSKVGKSATPMVETRESLKAGLRGLHWADTTEPLMAVQKVRLRVDLWAESTEFLLAAERAALSVLRRAVMKAVMRGSPMVVEKECLSAGQWESVTAGLMVGLMARSSAVMKVLLMVERWAVWWAM